MKEILEKLEKIIDKKLDSMSNSRYVDPRPTTPDEIYKIACAIKICDEIENNAFSRENKVKARETIEEMINDFKAERRGLK